MQIYYCFGCMEQIENYPCPHCGYMPGNASAYTLRPGSILRGKYLVGKVLGQGGFGITYIGLDLALQRKVAIKEFFPANCVGRDNSTSRVIWYDTPQARNAAQSGQELFLKEARKMSRVSSINAVVHVYDVFQENETAYICMEFIEGQTLQQMLKRTGPLPWEKAKEIFLPVIRTMAQVHQQGLVHRDLSPDNLMIQPDGTVKILDLGAAKDLMLNSGVSSMQVAKGGFSPLEQYLSSGESGTWTDVYAMGATLYYALTGVVPPTSMDRLNQDTLRWDLPQLQTLPPEVHKALEHAMAVRREDRTQTMEAFAAELEHTVSRVSGSVFPIDSSVTMADFADEWKQRFSRILKSIPPVNIKVAAAVIAVVVLGIGILNSGKETPEETLSVPETLETVPETTEAIPETTETVPETTETVPETTEPASSISVSQAEILIRDIAGKPMDELLSTYTEAVKLEKFWKSEGKPVKITAFPNTTPLLEKMSTYIKTPLLDKSGNTCGWKEEQTYSAGSTTYTDISGKTLWRKDSNSTIKFFYDSDGLCIRSISVSFFDIRDVHRDGESVEYTIYILYDKSDSTYSIAVKDFDWNDVLKKEYDFNGKLISSS